MNKGITYALMTGVFGSLAAVFGKEILSDNN